MIKSLSVWCGCRLLDGFLPHQHTHYSNYNIYIGPQQSARELSYHNFSLSSRCLTAAAVIPVAKLALALCAARRASGRKLISPLAVHWRKQARETRRVGADAKQIN